MDEDELMYTRIKNGVASNEEILNYINKLHKVMGVMLDDLMYSMFDPYITKEAVKEHYWKKSEERWYVNWERFNKQR